MLSRVCCLVHALCGLRSVCLLYSTSQCTPPQLQQLVLNFLATFLVVTLQNNRNTSECARKIFPIPNMRPLSIREPPDWGVFPPALTIVRAPVVQLDIDTSNNTGDDDDDDDDNDNNNKA